MDFILTVVICRPLFAAPVYKYFKNNLSEEKVVCRLGATSTQEFYVFKEQVNCLSRSFMLETLETLTSFTRVQRMECTKPFLKTRAALFL